MELDWFTYFCPPLDLEGIEISEDPNDAEKFIVTYTYKSTITRSQIDKIKSQLENKKEEISSEVIECAKNIDEHLDYLNSL